MIPGFKDTKLAGLKEMLKNDQRLRGRDREMITNFEKP
jgi:hypothetical protein